MHVDLLKRLQLSRQNRSVPGNQHHIVEQELDTLCQYYNPSRHVEMRPRRVPNPSHPLLQDSAYLRSLLIQNNHVQNERFGLESRVNNTLHPPLHSNFANHPLPDISQLQQNLMLRNPQNVQSVLNRNAVDSFHVNCNNEMFALDRFRYTPRTRNYLSDVASSLGLGTVMNDIPQGGTNYSQVLGNGGYNQGQGNQYMQNGRLGTSEPSLRIPHRNLPW